MVNTCHSEQKNWGVAKSVPGDQVWNQVPVTPIRLMSILGKRPRRGFFDSPNMSHVRLACFASRAKTVRKGTKQVFRTFCFQQYFISSSRSLFEFFFLSKKKKKKKGKGLPFLGIGLFGRTLKTRVWFLEHWYNFGIPGKAVISLSASNTHHLEILKQLTWELLNSLCSKKMLLMQRESRKHRKHLNAS